MLSYEKVLESTAVLTTVLQFLSGSLVCRKYASKKSTGDSSGFPFICGLLSCTLWLRYGSLTNQDILILVNACGVGLFLLYTLIYYVFTVNKRHYVKQSSGALLLLLSIGLYTNSLRDQVDAIRFMGVVCCIVTVCFFAAPFTMLLHVMRHKNSESLPFPLIVMSFLVSLQWLIYGILVSDTFIQIPNFLGCLLSLLQLSLFVIYPPKSFAGHAYKLVEQSVVL